uniref:differentially expressed in FDCP 8 homolog isoform X2 n=1 Tax=Myxine glutinosa TaxID=7769 RepID=UPI00358F9491
MLSSLPVAVPVLVSLPPPALRLVMEGKYREKLEQFRRNHTNPFNCAREDGLHKCEEVGDVGEEAEDLGEDAGVFQGAYSNSDSESCNTEPDLDSRCSSGLGLAEDYFAQPQGCDELSHIEELEHAIEMCKVTVLESPELSSKREQATAQLIRLRMKLQHLREPEEEEPDIKLILDHRFRKRKSRGIRHSCDKCNTLIWGMLHSWYTCTGCRFNCHSRCLNAICKPCVRLKVSHQAKYLMDICPEVGLHAQDYRCADCRQPITMGGVRAEARLCDYTGRYYCPSCHWNDPLPIPARALHNWDMEPHKVCRSSLRFLELMQSRPVINVKNINPALFTNITELAQIKKLRSDILKMKPYLVTCTEAMKARLLLRLQKRQHFVENVDMYSMQDLLEAAWGQLVRSLTETNTEFAKHIKLDCQKCEAKGFICEICNDGEALFPFDSHASVCPSCSAVFHRDCFFDNAAVCLKCLRLSSRKKSQERV